MGEGRSKWGGGGSEEEMGGGGGGGAGIGVKVGEGRNGGWM